MQILQQKHQNILIKLFHYYDTIIHEIRHAKQQQMIEENDLLLSKIHNDTINNIDMVTNILKLLE